MILLVTHPDDELVNMSNFFLNNSQCLSILVGGANKDRTEKFKKLMGDLKRAHAILPLYPDYLLGYDKNLVHDMIFEEILKCSNIDYLVIPSIYDDHPEHNLVTMIGMKISILLKVDVIFSTCTDKEIVQTTINEKIWYLKKYYPKEYADLLLMKHPIIRNKYTETHTLCIK